MRPQNIKNFHFLVKNRLTGATSLTDFEIFRGFYRPKCSTLISISNLTWFASHWETASRSTRPNFSVRPVGKTVRWIEKWRHLFDGHEELYHHAKFGEDHTTRAGCRSETWCLHIFCHASNPEHCAFEGCIVRTSIALPFIGRFRWGFQRFFIMDCSFRCNIQFSFSSLAPQFSRIAVKNFEKSKNRRKSLCAPLRTDSSEIWRKFNRNSLGPRMYMYTYIKKNFRMSLYNTDSNCQISYR